MNDQDKINELLKELEELRVENDLLKDLLNKENGAHKQAEESLLIMHMHRTAHLNIANKELRENAEKFRMIAEEAPVMVFVNNAGRVVYVNKKCEEVLGYTREEFLAPEFNFIDLIAPEYVKMARENFAKRYKGTAKESYMYALLTKDKRKIESYITSKMIDYDGERSMLGIVTDITELKQAAEALKNKSEELEQFNDYLVGRELKIIELERRINELITKPDKVKNHLVQK